jgi:hypothetical protein
VRATKQFRVPTSHPEMKAWHTGGVHVRSLVQRTQLSNATVGCRLDTGRSDLERCGHLLGQTNTYRERKVTPEWNE